MNNMISIKILEKINNIIFNILKRLDNYINIESDIFELEDNFEYINMRVYIIKILVKLYIRINNKIIILVD